jgi:hypothetical protein
VSRQFEVEEWPVTSHVVAREPDPNGFVNPQAIGDVGLTHKQIAKSIVGTYRLLDRIDATLTADGVDPLCRIVELANLSSMIGNIIGAEIAKNSAGLYRRNGPHKYPDLLPVGKGAAAEGVEIKMALNRNQPKGHLAKPGHYITCRYVLIDKKGAMVTEAADRPKATSAAIWELRTGYLSTEHFALSNTAGDSGKTAVINAAGMDELKVIYVDLALVPGTQRGAGYQRYLDLFGRR